MTLIHSPDGGWDPAVAIALNFAEQRQHPAIASVLSLDIELASLSRQGLDSGVAQAKLGWWADEFERFASGQSRHPLTQSLAELGLPLTQLDSWLRLLAAHQASAVAPSELQVPLVPDRGAAYGVLAKLIGNGDAVDIYETAGQAAAPLLKPATLGMAPEDARALASQLSEANVQLAQLANPSQHRFLIVLTKVVQRRALAVANTGDAGLRNPGPLALLWVSWRAAMKARP